MDRRTFVATAGTLLATGCLGGGSSNDGGDGQSEEPTTTLSGPPTSASLNEQWTVDAFGKIVGNTDGAIYTATTADDAKVARIETGGTVTWEGRVGLTPGGIVESSAGTFAKAFDAPVVAALDTSSGSERWRHRFEGGDGGTAIAADGSQVVAADTPRGGSGADSTVAVFDPESGDRRKRIDVDSAPEKLELVDGTLLVGGRWGLAAYDVESGTQNWKKRTSGSWTVAGGEIYLSGFEGISVIDLETGENTRTLASSLEVGFPEPTVDGSVLAYKSESGPVAFDADSGERLWSADIWDSDFSHQGLFALEDGILYTAPFVATGDEELALKLFAAETGTKLTENSSFGKTASFTVVDRTLFAVSLDTTGYDVVPKR